MCSPFWILGIIPVLIGAVFGSELLRDDAVPVRRCYHCEDHTLNNGTSSCNNQTMEAGDCAADKQYCATEFLTSSSKSTYFCASEMRRSLLYFNDSRGANFRVTCTCGSQLCNRPLPESLIHELKEFSSQTLNVTNGTDVTHIFLNTSIIYGNIDNKEFYLRICEGVLTNNEKSEVTTGAPQTVRINLPISTNVSESGDSPRAEALKHEVTAPSDDEEDDVEGSGGWREEARIPKRPAPDAPSSYLPAHENKGSYIFINPIVMAPLLLYVMI